MLRCRPNGADCAHHRLHALESNTSGAVQPELDITGVNLLILHGFVYLLQTILQHL